MAFKKTFEVSNEDVNSYGFVTLTAGILLDAAKQNCPAFYEHAYWQGTVGHWENFQVDGVKLFADYICEGITQQEQDIIKKIEAGDIKGASIGADPLKWSSDPVLLKSGQIAPTLIQSELFEISLTPLPGNKSALALKKDGQAIRLNVTNINNIIPKLKLNTDMKAIAIKLGLKEDATESEILRAIESVQLSNTNHQAITKEILDKASEGLEGEQKEIFVTLSKTSVKQAVAYANNVKPATEDHIKMESQAAGVKLTKDVKVSELLKLGKGQHATEEGKDSFDYLSKYNKAELKRIHAEEPEKYIQLTREYAKGVRYTGKTA